MPGLMYLGVNSQLLLAPSLSLSEVSDLFIGVLLRLLSMLWNIVCKLHGRELRNCSQSEAIVEFKKHVIELGVVSGPQGDRRKMNLKKSELEYKWVALRHR